MGAWGCEINPVLLALLHVALTGPGGSRITPTPGTRASSGASADASDCFAGMFVWLRWFSNQGHGPAHPLQRRPLSRVPELRAACRILASGIDLRNLI